jgi:hypothetical protein
MVVVTAVPAVSRPAGVVVVVAPAAIRAMAVMHKLCRDFQAAAVVAAAVPGILMPIATTISAKVVAVAVLGF